MKVKLLIIGEFEVDKHQPLAGALTQLDAFREAVQPAAEYGISLYRATAPDVAGFAGALWRSAELVDHCDDTAGCASCDQPYSRHCADDGSCIVEDCLCEVFERS